MWCVEEINDRIQELIGEPVGGFYNISMRLKSISQARNEMLNETYAVQVRGSVAIEAGTDGDLFVGDFMRLGEDPVYFHGTGGTAYPLEVIATSKLEAIRPGWDHHASSGIPQYLVQRGSSFRLYPTPNQAGTLSFSYIPYPPDYEDMSDLVFGDWPELDVFAPGLAYRVASDIVRPRNAELGNQYYQMYVLEERKMRHYSRTNPQKPQMLQPTVRWRKRYASGR